MCTYHGCPCFPQHGRRQFVDVAEKFPDECRYVPEMLGQVYLHDAEARERSLTPYERLRSQPAGDGQTARVAGGAVSRVPNGAELRAGPGYLLSAAPLASLDVVSSQSRAAPLDNNIVERSLKRAVLHRKNALFYRTLNGAQVGDLFMSLIHTCQLCGANSFDYMVELQSHAMELAACPAEWMPWNYRETLARTLHLPDPA